MPKVERHQWEFRARFRRNAFGWKSQPPIKRVKEAVSEIKKVARKDALLAAEGAVLLLEKLSPALTHVDSSSGSIGSAVNKAIEALGPIVSEAPADAKTRDAWLDRLWVAYEEDGIPYIELLADYWGELCGSQEVASRWADRFIEECRASWSQDQRATQYFRGTVPCLSSLLAAERHQELLDLLATAPYRMWDYSKFGVRALVGMGKKAEAIRFAEDNRGRNDGPAVIARACEEILLSSGLADEAYRRYGLQANEAGTYLAWFRAVAKRYPDKAAAEILGDLVASTPGEEGKWFAAAKSASLFDEAIVLAMRSPGSPQTLTRAARDFAEKNPSFALEAGMAALHWLVEGYGYEITSADVHDAYSHAMAAAENAGRAEETKQRIRELVSKETFGNRFVTKVLGHQLGLS